MFIQKVQQLQKTYDLNVEDMEKPPTPSYSINKMHIQFNTELTEATNKQDTNESLLKQTAL